ncbi:hypoxanthine phosphoribosyltransferase [Cognataquiflexum rubidum]|uniref:hypoxanthine phosphoribosyltransferase n=1 Tax=Cognataquiflexum rubidum TaxID=2922273 RepID=UPI001F1292B8|nr:hypoxanthine phosphoribosyltransferase [Cognataquiflexum rubidum]MCH6234614.1 hypoxanthine phosphoribosyltransferase [Cognataquiflexum rubidum]
MISIKDKVFVPYITANSLQQRVAEIGAEISRDFKGDCPVLIGVLNGSFVFLSDLAKSISIPIEVSFVKVSSYSGTNSTGEVKNLLGLDIELNNRSVIIVEDIIDTGLSMKHLLEMVQRKNPKKLAVATLLLKPEALTHPLKVSYIGFEIPNKFVVGYGMDFDGLGRNLPELYQLK